MKIYNGIVHD